MGPVSTGSRLRALAAVAVIAISTALLSACASSSGGGDANLIAGKQLFVGKCGACHTLARAGTTGTTGPNLDDAFRQSLADGLERNGIEGAIHEQILRPSSDGGMPAALVEGEDASDVAAYVASVVAKTGKDTGLLATAVKKAGGGGPVAAKDGTLEMDTDPGGQLAYTSKSATAPAGRLTIRSKNDASTPHDIVIDGKGKGETVTGGGVSEFSAEFEPGTYTYYCSIPGHREGGMEGRLVVK